jgi:hydroxymethylpyrimidine pyrophosphatase-like HAD family hydrolase
MSQTATLPVKRLLASDLDGTFLSKNGDITKANIKAVAKAQESDLEIVFVTGRPARWLSGVSMKTGHTGHVIGANGGFVADLASRRVVSSNVIDKEIALDAAMRIQEKFPDVTFAVERAFVGMEVVINKGVTYDLMKTTRTSDVQLAVSPGYADGWLDISTIPVAPIRDLLELGQITKLIAKPLDVSAWNTDDWLAEIAPLVSDLVQVTHAAQTNPLAEISALGVNKGTALADLISSYGMSREDVVAIGDMPNDIPMLQWASEGWAVNHAHEEVLAIADYITPADDESPVAHLIYNLLSR